MADVYTSVERGLYQALTASPGTTLYAQRVYASQARIEDPTFAEPYVVFMLINASEENVHNEGRTELYYQIGVWSRDDGKARTGFNYIRDALHQKTLNVTPFTNTWTTLDDYITLVDNYKGLQYYYRGATFRILLTGT